MRMIKQKVGLMIILGYLNLKSITSLSSTTPKFSISIWNQEQEQKQKQEKPSDPHLLHIQTHPSFIPSIISLHSFQSHPFNQLITHSPSNQNQTFSQRFWFDVTHYKEGGPVFLLDGGETNGEDRLPFLHDGILAILSKATNGIGIILEHRYYGQSFPFADLSTDSLRYLNTRESLDDSAYFSRHIILPGYEHLNITSPGTPWIYYGGSYAGAKAAFMMKLYPNLIWGSLASSAVIHAQVDFWQYYEPIRIHAPQDCIEPLIMITRSIDRILSSKDSNAIKSLKEAFGLSNVTDDRDFVNVLASPIGSWQERNWDSKISTNEFEKYCNTLKRNDSNHEKNLPHSLSSLKRFFKLEENFPISSFLNYLRYIKENISQNCDKLNQDECFGTGNITLHQLDGLDQTWRSWMWQVCTEWGYFQNSSPGDKVSLISKLIDLEYNSRTCQLAFGSSVPKRPDTTMVNQYGDFNLESTRLGFIDGNHDPWLYATVHSPLIKNRTIQNSFVIEGGIHHWDENGRDDDEEEEPEEIRNVHQTEIEWVKNWIDEFYRNKL
ncbi:extracellular serine carboxypeptidase [Melampsora americana]|nr:extracellular serine carboxypeptidase [Melampsora americana]